MKGFQTNLPREQNPRPVVTESGRTNLAKFHYNSFSEHEEKSMQFPLNAVKNLLKFNFFFLPIFFSAILLLQKQKSSIPDLSSSRALSPKQFVQSFQQMSTYDQQLLQDQQRKIAQHSQEIQHLRAVLHSYEQQATARTNKVNLPTIVSKAETETQLVSSVYPFISSQSSNTSSPKATSTQSHPPNFNSTQPTDVSKLVASKVSKDERFSRTPVLPLNKASTISSQPSAQPTETQETGEENVPVEASSIADSANNITSLAQSTTLSLTAFSPINNPYSNFHEKAEQKSLDSPSNAHLQAGKNNFIQLANDAAFGLIVADQKGHITYGTYNYRKVQTAINLLRRGKDPQNAAKRSNLSPAVLAQVIKWGDKRPGRLDIDALSYQKSE